jgi:glycopeptide antibiotics resistance protein
LKKKIKENQNNFSFLNLIPFKTTFFEGRNFLTIFLFIYFGKTLSIFVILAAKRLNLLRKVEKKIKENQNNFSFLNLIPFRTTFFEGRNFLTIFLYIYFG